MIFSDPSVQFVLENMMDAFIAYDPQWRFKYINAKAEILMAHPREELLGKVLWEIFPQTLGTEIERNFRAVAETGESADFTDYVPETETWLNLRAFRYPTMHIGVFWNDITSQKKAEIALRNSNDRWNLAVEGAEEGIWDWDLRNNEVFYSTRWKAHLGYIEEEIAPTLEEWHGRIHPEDLPRTLQAIEDHIAGKTDRFSEEYRLRHKDGSYRWIKSRGRALRSTRGVVVRMAGSHEDVTEQKEMERKIRASDQRFRAFLNHLPDAIFLKDSAGRLVYINELAEKILRPYSDRWEGLTDADFLKAEIAEQNRLIEERTWREGSTEVEQEVQTEDGLRNWWIQRFSYEELEGQMMLGGIISDVTDIRQAQRDLARINVELEAARDAALAASKSKSEFLANMSHEIRTPLNGVLATASLLLEVGLDPKNHEYVDMIVRSGRTLMRVIDDILDMSKIEAGRMVMELVAEKPASILEDVVELYRNQAKARELTLVAHAREPIPPSLSIDGTRLRQVLGNLVGNGLKFTKVGGVEIILTSSPLGNQTWRLEITVSDTGMGIDLERLSQIFEPFAQAESDTYRRFGGTGLGLSISKRIIELMGGILKVESDVGKGSRFTIILDCVEAESDLPLHMAHAGRSRQGVTVLVAEDNEVNAIVATDVLERLGCVVTHVWDGKAAVEEAEKTDFDLILLDIHMPVHDGLEACRLIRGSSKRHRPEIGALTASVTPGEVARCLDAGMDFVHGKPFNFDQMRRMLADRFPATVTP